MAIDVKIIISDGGALGDGSGGGGGGGNMVGIKYLSSYGADFSASWASSQAAADAAWTAATAAMASGAIHTLLIDAGDVLAHSSAVSLSVPSGCSVIGFGYGSTIHTSANNPVFDITGDRTVIADVRVFGDSGGVNNPGNPKTSQHAVRNGLTQFYEGMTLRMVYAEQMSGDAFRFQQGQSGGSPIRTSSVIGCVATSGQRKGFSINTQGEYITFSDCHVTLQVGSNWFIAAGNSSLVGCVSTESQTAGIELGAGFNNSHGSITGMRCNHNAVSLIGDAITDGFLFSDCHFIAPTVGQVQLTSSIGIRFSNCHFYGPQPFSFDGSVGTTFDDSCVFDESGGAIVIQDNVNGNASQTLWGDCRTLADTNKQPAAISARRQIAGFPSDADHALTIQEDTAARIVVPSAAISADRTLTSSRAPAAGMPPVPLTNETAHNVHFQWSTGSAVTVPANSWALIGCVDGTNASVLES